MARGERAPQTGSIVREGRKMGELSGKKALVSGSTGGIGLAVAEGLARKGASVVLNGRTEERVAAAVEKVKAAVPSAEVCGVAADLGTAEGVAAVTAAHPTVDVLVNNLGIFGPKPFGEISDEEWMHIFEVNVMSGVRLSRHYLPKMIDVNWGRIINVSSEAGLNVVPQMLHYSLTKTAQYSLNRGLAEMTKGTGVTVNAVAPGPTMTDGVRSWLEGLAEQTGKPVEEVEKSYFVDGEGPHSSLLMRFLTEEEVAAPILYLASPASSGTNGSIMRVDGGIYRAVI